MEKKDLLVIYWVIVEQYIMIRTQWQGFVKQDFTCENDPRFSNETPLK